MSGDHTGKDVQPLWNQRALIAGNSLVIADLHIGYESELKKSGVNLPSQTPKISESVVELLRDKNLTNLVINGDLKHNIPQATWQEYEEIPEVIDRWLQHVESIHLFPGNHDGGIEKWIPSEVVIHDSSGGVLDGVGFFHGHARPKEKVLKTGNIVTSHGHPTITLTDSMGRKEKKECWIRFEYRYQDIEGQGVLMPHYNALLGGISINEKGYLGPFFRHQEIKNERVYLLNGAYLGELDALRNSNKSDDDWNDPQ